MTVIINILLLFSPFDSPTTFRLENTNFRSVFSSLFQNQRKKETIDLSQYDFPKPIWYSIPGNEMAIKLITLVPVIGCGIVGNALLLNIIARNRSLQTPTNLMLANMVAADTITLLFCPATFICRDFFQNFVLDAIGCRMEGYLQGDAHWSVPLEGNFFFDIIYLSVARVALNEKLWPETVYLFTLNLMPFWEKKMTMSFTHTPTLTPTPFISFAVTFLITAVLSLCAVSYDRLTAIVLPRESRVSMRGAKIIMIFTWLTGFTLALPLAIYRDYRVRKNFITFGRRTLRTQQRKSWKQKYEMKK